MGHTPKCEKNSLYSDVFVQLYAVVVSVRARMVCGTPQCAERAREYVARRMHFQKKFAIGILDRPLAHPLPLTPRNS